MAQKQIDIATSLSRPGVLRISRDEWQLLAVWLLLRVSTLMMAALNSALCPQTDIEKAVQAWPPSAPYTRWFERILLAPWDRWDAAYYLSIIKSGFQAGNGTTQFHPLYPWLATPIVWLFGHPMLGLLGLSSLAGACLTLAFYRLARMDMACSEASFSTMLLLTAPLSFALFAPYTESLFLLFSVLCLHSLRQNRWMTAGTLGALATLTRPQGLLLVLPMCWEIRRMAGGTWRAVLRNQRALLSLGLIPVSMLGWVLYRAFALGDFKLEASSPKALLISLLLSPSAHQVVPNQTFTWPWKALWMALSRVSEPDTAVDLIAGTAFLVLACLAWRNMRACYKIYVLAIIMLSFSYHTGPVHPFMGLPRHLLLAFPIFIGLGPVFVRPWSRLLVVTSGALGMFFLLTLYVLLPGWVP